MKSVKKELNTDFWNNKSEPRHPPNPTSAIYVKSSKFSYSIILSWTCFLESSNGCSISLWLYITVLNISFLKLQFFFCFILYHFLSRPLLSSCIFLFSFFLSYFKIFLSSFYFLIKQKQCGMYGSPERWI